MTPTKLILDKNNTRKSIFLDNAQYIFNHNTGKNGSDTSFTLGVNDYSGVSKIHTSKNRNASARKTSESLDSE